MCALDLCLCVGVGVLSTTACCLCCACRLGLGLNGAAWAAVCIQSSLVLLLLGYLAFRCGSVCHSLSHHAACSMSQASVRSPDL